MGFIGKIVYRETSKKRGRIEPKKERQIIGELHMSLGESFSKSI